MLVVMAVVVLGIEDVNCVVAVRSLINRQRSATLTASTTAIIIAISNIIILLLILLYIEKRSRFWVG